MLVYIKHVLPSNSGPFPHLIWVSSQDCHRNWPCSFNALSNESCRVAATPPLGEVWLGKQSRLYGYGHKPSCSMALVAPTVLLTKA
jgi:hypothetical protein